jgi:hypothetical protein
MNQKKLRCIYGWILSPGLNKTMFAKAGPAHGKIKCWPSRCR